MGTKREECAQIEELEERLASMEVKREELCQKDAEVSHRLHRLQKENWENLQPLRQELDQKERAITEVLEQMRKHQEQHENMMQTKQLEHQKRVRDIQDKVHEVSTESKEKEEKFCVENEQLQSKLSDLKQQIQDQQKELMSKLERVKNQEKERLDREVQKLLRPKVERVEMCVKEKLLEQWNKEKALHQDCVSEIYNYLHQHRLTWDTINNLNDQHQQHQKDIVQQTANHVWLTRENHRLRERIKRSSRLILELNSQKVSLNQRKEAAQQETDQLRAQLKGEYLQISEEVKQQKLEKARLEVELKTRRNQRMRMENSFRTAVDFLERLIQDPQKDSPLVQQLSDLFSTDVSDAEFCEYTTREFYGPDASEQRIRQESERLMLILTDPEFLLRCARKNDISTCPRSSWHHPPAPDSSNKGTTNIWIP